MVGVLAFSRLKSLRVDVRVITPSKRAEMVATHPRATMRRPTLMQMEEFRRRILAWFEMNGRSFPWRKSSARLYELVVSEVLLQRTRAEVVAAFLPRFLRQYPSWRRLAAANPSALEQCLRPLGLWKRRATSLLALAREMRARGGRLPLLRADIDQLPGVGQYIGNAIGLFAAKRAEPLLDVNMARVLERCFGTRKLADIRYDPLLQDLAHLAVEGTESTKLNWGILDLAALVCSHGNPACTDCPLLGLCAEGRAALRRGRVARGHRPLGNADLHAHEYQGHRTRKRAHSRLRSTPSS
jgi:A/G-specific adenine glycosylase